MSLPAATDTTLRSSLAPRSIAIIGASENPHKIGGRPVAYLQRFGYRGTVYPINPTRPEIQGHKSFASLADLPAAPDLAIIAVPGSSAVQAVEACAERGVGVAVIMTSGFGETGAEGKRQQDHMVAVARSTGMRLVGPNTQGIANFATGAGASLAPMLSGNAPMDGPIGIVSQSGAMSVVPYALLRERGIGVRHSHATGNECDLSVADFALAVAQDPDVKLLLLYMEAVADPQKLEEAARIARLRDLPIVALKAGSTSGGAAAASSHTGALATEDRVVDAFFRQQGIWRVPDMHGLVNAAELYLKGWRPSGRKLVAISNSGASCVMAADLAERNKLPLGSFEPEVRDGLRKALPEFAATANPVDLTAALLTNNRLFGDILPILSNSDAADLFYIAIPIAGTGYDVPSFAADTAAFTAQTGKPTVAAIPQSAIAKVFRDQGVPTFAYDSHAIAALAQLAGHVELMRRKPAQALEIAAPKIAPGSEPFLSEWDSMEVLKAAGLPIVSQRLCHSADEAAAAFAALGAKVVVKACSAKLPHKSEYGLVLLNVATEQAARAAIDTIAAKLKEMKLPFEGVIVAQMVKASREFVLGGRMDPQFGPVVMLGDGGKYVEALKDYALLRHPFGAADAIEALEGLRVAPLFKGVRGEQEIVLQPLAEMARRLGALLAAAQGEIASIDLNPVMAVAGREEFVIADALIERRQKGQ
jgi:acyl-CoA synthetase (NDP forming)